MELMTYEEVYDFLVKEKADGGDEKLWYPSYHSTCQITIEQRGHPAYIRFDGRGRTSIDIDEILELLRLWVYLSNLLMVKQ
jgi:hypothetical protein